MFLKNNYFIFWLWWVFIAVHRISLVAASKGYSLAEYSGFSLQRLRLLWSSGLGTWASVVLVHGRSSHGSQALECRISSCGGQS